MLHIMGKVPNPKKAINKTLFRILPMAIAPAAAI